MKRAIVAAVAALSLLASCGEEPSQPTADTGIMCVNKGKKYDTEYEYYMDCPSEWCKYTKSYMTQNQYKDIGLCTPKSSSSAIVSSSSRPRSSSSARPMSSSSVDVCPTKKCDCTPGFDEVYREVMGEYAAIGMAHSSGAKSEAARRAGCTL